jgi:hypothetical protein
MFDPERFSPVDHEQFAGLVAITSMFTRRLPGRHDMISPSRVAAIPEITAYHCSVVRPARGELGTHDVVEAWQQRKPDHYGRHPDFLFDLTRLNFGSHSVAEAEQIARKIMAADYELAALREAVRSRIAREQTRQSYEPRLNQELPPGY